MFWISPGLILVFLLMAFFPQLFATRTRTTPISTTPARHHPPRLFGRDGQGYDVYTRTIYGARASISVGILATLFPSCSVAGGHHRRLPGGWVRLLHRPLRRDLPRDPAAARRHLVPLRLPERPPTTPFLVAVSKVAFVLGLPRLAGDHAADAVQRPPGEAERLRPGGPGTRAPRRSGSSARTSCPTPWPRWSWSPRSIWVSTSRSRPRCPSSASGCSRRPSPGASRSLRPPASG